MRPERPKECTAKVPHAPLVAGRQAMTIINQGRAALELQWDYQDLCTRADELYWAELRK